MLATLAQFGGVVVLSGDVHYAFTNVTAYHVGRSQRPRTHRATVLQRTEERRRMTMVIQSAGYAGFERVGRSWLGTNRQPTALEHADLMSRMPDPTSNHPWDARQLFNIINALGVTLSLGDTPAILARYAGKLAKRVARS